MRTIEIDHRRLRGNLLIKPSQVGTDNLNAALNLVERFRGFGWREGLFRRTLG